MSAWAGWVGDFISGLGIPDTADNRAFLVGWAAAEPSTCKFNPLVCAKSVAGSTNCRPSPGGLHTQNYPTHAAAISATRSLLHSGIFPALLGALESGHPLAQFGPDALVGNLDLWGAGAWAQEVADKTGVKLPGVKSAAPAHVSKAWTRLMRILAHKGPDAHNRIRHSTSRARRIAR